MNLKVEMITTAEAAKQLGTTPAILSACIENKTIPVGGVAVGKQRRTLIVLH